MDLKEARQRHYGFVSSLILLDDIGVLSFPSEYNVKMGGGWWRVCVWWGGEIINVIGEIVWLWNHSQERGTEGIISGE